LDVDRCTVAVYLNHQMSVEARESSFVVLLRNWWPGGVAIVGCSGWASTGWVGRAAGRRQPGHRK